MKKSTRTILWVLVVLVSVLAVYGVYLVVHAQSGLSAAREMMEFQLWPQARERTADYLWLHPRDGRANLLMAEAFAKDDALPPDRAAEGAISYLERIPGTSPDAAEARLQQARLHFLILQQPQRAEELVRQSIKLQDDNLQAYQLLWTLLNVTGRAEMAEDVFWRVYELSPEQERPLRLRDWYLGLFMPGSANESLDRMMGIIAPDESPTRTTESRRYLRFREAEPEAAGNHAAIARWCQLEGDLEFASRLLQAATEEVPDANSDPFFLMVNIAVQLDLGEYENAEQLFEQWPEDDRGHFYWRTRALILDDVIRDHEQALDAYERALETWPGPADWRLQFRKAGCLARLRRAEEAARVREHAEGVQALMVPEAHERLLNALNSLEERASVEELIEFYEQLGREREVAGWTAFANRLAPAQERPRSDAAKQKATSEKEEMGQ